MKQTSLIMLGTRKGAFVFESQDGRRTWKSSGPYFRGEPIFHVTYDRRTSTMYAALANDFTGTKVARSADRGRTWKLGRTPPKFPKGSDWSAKRVWHIEPGHEDEQDTLYCGIDPAALFKSTDRGDTWTLNRALFDQPTRPKWNPGAGGLCLHTIMVDPRDKDTMQVAISSVGNLKTTDGGETWKFKNKNIRQDFGPVKYPEWGQCPHHFARHPSRPNVIYHQNHCGQYRSDDNGETWKDIQGNLPSRFGFAVAVDYNDPKRVYVAPEESGAARLPVGERFQVWGSDDEGKSWSPLDKGLPRKSFFTVYREGMDTDEDDPSGVYFGTATGQLYFSKNAGESWNLVAEGLPPILSVNASRA